jgi:hypothetical protein
MMHVTTITPLMTSDALEEVAFPQLQRHRVVRLEALN